MLGSNYWSSAHYNNNYALGIVGGILFPFCFGPSLSYFLALVSNLGLLKKKTIILFKHGVCSALKLPYLFHTYVQD